MLIQGPPGTGKTTTIVETVLQIFNQWRINNPGTSYPRILITAPSNAAVEELVLKLISFDLEDDQLFNMMTVGIKHSAHRSININDIIFERKLEGEMGKILKLEAEDRKAKLILLLEELQNETDEDKQTQLNIKIKAEKEFIRTAEESKIPNLPENVKSRLKEMATEQVLGPVDIIATTLSGSMDSCMEKFFVTKDCGNSNLRPFSICIVDNAGQCVEPEMLIPFALGFTKLIMVGDPVQLPTTVSSQLAKDMKYDESMFKRFIKFFEGSKSTTLKLDMQYRMHPEITNWPNSYFYEGALANGPQNRKFPFQNYLLFDMPRSTEQLFGSDGLFNEKEAEFVANLAKAVRDQKLRRSIGVITFYLKQKNRISQKLKERGLKVSNDLKANIANGIKVQTVEDFQGSECDIIIISCVRGENSYNRKSMGSVPNEQQLNVALTRAKYSL